MTSQDLAQGAAQVQRVPLEALRRRPVLLGLAGLLLLAVAIVAGVAMGTVAVPLAETVAILLHRAGWPVDQTWAASSETIVVTLRLPRVLTALVVGLGLSVAGVTYQGLLRNPLADPYVLGTASGAALGAAIGVLLPIQLAWLGLGLTNILAFVGALLAISIVYRVAGGGGRATMTSILLTGYAVGSMLAAGLSLAMYLSGAQLRQIFYYLLGSLSGADWQSLALGLPVVAVGTFLILARSRALNGLLLGEDTALHLGVDVRRERAILLALASLVTAAAVALAGLIGFVGLVIPHIVRLVVGPNARLVLPLSAIWGGAFLVTADLGARLMGELPVGIITAAIGAPVFVYLLRRYRAAYQL
ncbi:MAG: iron chelate uptake ABC transporter family permease subunit [Candidatus Limnocylindrales bacterium]